jgi:hypothetical protein
MSVIMTTNRIKSAVGSPDAMIRQWGGSGPSTTSHMRPPFMFFAVLSHFSNYTRCGAHNAPRLMNFRFQTHVK